MVAGGGVAGGGEGGAAGWLGAEGEPPVVPGEDAGTVPTGGLGLLGDPAAGGPPDPLDEPDPPPPEELGFESEDFSEEPPVGTEGVTGPGSGPGEEKLGIDGLEYPGEPDEPPWYAKGDDPPPRLTGSKFEPTAAPITISDRTAARTASLRRPSVHLATLSLVAGTGRGWASSGSRSLRVYLRGWSAAASSSSSPSALSISSRRAARAAPTRSHHCLSPLGARTTCTDGPPVMHHHSPPGHRAIEPTGQTRPAPSRPGLVAL